MSRKKADIIASIIMIFISVLIIFQISVFKKINSLDIGPAFFPKVLAGILFILALLIAVNALKTREDETIVFINRNFMMAICAIIVYCILFNVIGFVISSVLLLSFLMKIMGAKGLRRIILTNIIIIMVVYTVFNLFLNVPLPWGVFANLL